MTALAEADVEDAALEWLTALGWQAAHGPDIGPGGTSEERRQCQISGRVDP